MTEGLISPAKPDGFTHESPIRAFTEFRQQGTWAIGKGFRPSLSHLHTYLDAMERKEGWHMVQLLDGGTLDPTLIFQKRGPVAVHIDMPTGSDAIPAMTIEPWMTSKSDVPIPYERIPSFLSYAAEWLQVEEATLVLEYSRTPAEEHDNPLSTAARLVRCPILHDKSPLLLKRVIDGYRVQSAERTLALQPAVTSAALAVYIDTAPMLDAEAAAIEDDCDDQETSAAAKRIAFDDVNPAHYGGWECGDIGERLSGNGYQMLKYCWRLGKKDDPCKEVGKAIRYCDRELALLNNPGLRHSLIRPNVAGIKATHVESFMEDRIKDQSTFTQNIARMLWAGYNVRRLVAIREALAEHAFHLDCGRGLAI